MIHLASIACLVASRMWLGSDCCADLWGRGSRLLLRCSHLWLWFLYLSFFFFFPSTNLSPAFCYTADPEKVPGCVAMHVVPQWALCCALHAAPLPNYCCMVTLLCSSGLPWSRPPVCPVLQLFLGWLCSNPRMTILRGQMRTRLLNVCLSSQNDVSGRKMRLDAACVCCPRNHC